MNESHSSIAHSQVGLPNLSKHMIFATYHLRPGAVEGEQSLDTYARVRRLANEFYRYSRTYGSRFVITAFDLTLWLQWCAGTGRRVPKACSGDIVERIHHVLDISPPYRRTGGHLYFHIKSDDEEGATELESLVHEKLADITEGTEITKGNHLREGRVYGRRILHGLIRSVDPVNLSARVITGDEDPEHEGSCYCLTQRFVHDWEAIGRMSEVAIENMIGRDRHGNLVPNSYERSHLKRARVLDERGLSYRILTQGQPWGDAPSGHRGERGVYVCAYAKSLEGFNAVLESMVGPERGFILDEHFTVSASDQGNIWYVPSAEELGVGFEHPEPPVPINDFFEGGRSKNGLMYYNSNCFLHHWGRQATAENQPTAESQSLSRRIMELLGNTFSRWHNNWYRPVEYPDLGHLRDHPHAPPDLEKLSIAERKGLSIRIMLGEQLTGELGRDARVFRIDSKEILVGVAPPFTLGTGVRVMRYLTDSEQLDAYFMALDETSMAGHTVPDYHTLTAKGLGVVLQEAREALASAIEAGHEKQRQFYQSAVYALEGVQKWFRKHAALARRIRDELEETQKRKWENLDGIARRMEKLTEVAPETFLEVAQLVFGVHCCLHLIGELVSLGRLDQVLAPFYERDTISEEAAQEVIDALWIKMDEPVMMNRQYFPDDRTFGTCAVPYRGGALVPQGDKASQWVMQATVGGYLPNDELEPQDGCNPVTMLCLRAARRLPLNAPCLSLRVNPHTPAEFVHEAALAILSGGAAPYLFNDDLICRSLTDYGGDIPLRDARDYCADGCWEPIVVGKTELALTYVPVLNAIEAALNRGATYSSAGPTYLRGNNISFQSPAAEDIGHFDDFMEIFYRHYHWLAAQAMNGFATNYGNLWKVCPSPLLSALTDGCLEAGRDLTDGGARYHMLSPQILGLPCAVDSLWAIYKLVFDPGSAVTTLAELRDALVCDWGHDMIEPLQSRTAGEQRAELRAARYRNLRELALGLKKFGNGHPEVDRFAGDVASRLGQIFMDIHEQPVESVSPSFSQRLEAIKRSYDIDGRPFAFKLTPGFGTFEDYLGLGLAAGASADGRRKGATLSSNMSPMPSPSDQAPERDRRARGIFTTLEGWNGETFEPALGIPGPVDIDIPEDFPAPRLVDVIRAFGRGELGFNIMSITCCDLETMEEAVKFPERYDLLRLRMGGWNEFFIVMFPPHQRQHMRRPVFVLDDEMR